MFIFADQAAYEDILLQRDSDPTLQGLAVEKVTDIQELIEKMTALPHDAEVIVFFEGKGYRGDNATVAAKIATERGLL